jgi:hypothetical protein
MNPLLMPEPPSNTGLEQAVLGAIMVSREAYAEVAGLLRPEHFFEPVHGQIYATMRRLIERGEVADQNTLLNAVLYDPELNADEVGGPRKYLGDCAHFAAPVVNVASYGRQLVSLHARREAMARAHELMQVASAETCEHADVLRIARGLQDLQVTVAPDDTPALDWDAVAEQDPPPLRCLIEKWHPVGYAGLFAGGGGAGKTFLEILKAICLASGQPFLGYEVEQCRAMVYLAEDDQDEIWRRAKRICASLKIDPRILRDECLLISTHGRRVSPLFVSDGDDVRPTDFFERVAGRARRDGRRYVGFDHLKRLCAIDGEKNTAQAFRLFDHLDAFAAEIDGAVTFLVHPSKSNVSMLGTEPFNAMAHVGGVASLTQAPRFVHSLSKQEIEGRETLVLANAKPNRFGLFGIKLELDGHGVAQFDGDYEPAKAAKKETRADGVLRVLKELYLSTRLPVPIDDLVKACVAQKIYEQTKDDAAFRDRKRKVNTQLEKHAEKRLAQPREGEKWAPIL